MVESGHEESIFHSFYGNYEFCNLIGVLKFAYLTHVANSSVHTHWMYNVPCISEAAPGSKPIVISSQLKNSCFLSITSVKKM